MGVLDIFKFLGRLAKRAFGFAREAGLTDGTIQQALGLVRQAAVEFGENDTRREWVIAALKAAGIKESIARLAVELAVQLWKKEDAPAP